MSETPPPSVPGNQAAMKASERFISGLHHKGRPERKTDTTGIPYRETEPVCSRQKHWEQSLNFLDLLGTLHRGLLRIWLSRCRLLQWILHWQKNHLTPRFVDSFPLYLEGSTRYLETHRWYDRCLARTESNHHRL